MNALPVRVSSRALRLRLASADDAERLLAWRNDPGTRGASLQSDAVTPAQHRRWLDAALASPAQVRLWMAHDDEHGVLVGTGRHNWRAPNTYRGVVAGRPVVELSLTVAPEHRGRGYGTRLVAALVAAAPPEWIAAGAAQLVAVVTPGNTASRRAFASNGFVEAHADARLVTLARALEEAPPPTA